MYKICGAVVLVVAVCAQANDFDDINLWIAHMFDKTNLGQNRNPTVDNKHQASNAVLPTNLNANDRQNIECTMETGEPGVCLRYFLCNANNSLITDGAGLFDLRSRKKRSNFNCPSFIDTCCRSANIRHPGIPSAPKPDVQLQREGCGWRNPEGIGFKTTSVYVGKATFGEIPWMVAIMNVQLIDETDPGSEKRHIYVGGGSLIHPKAVLTAAHNVFKSYTLKVRAGEWDTRNTHEIYPHQDRYVSHVEVHKDYNKNNLFYDIAILFLASPMDAAPNVGWACLPPPQEVTPPGTRCITVGWGKDKLGKEGRYQPLLKKAEVPVVEKHQCQKQLREIRLGPFFKLHHSFMCAGGETGKGTCTGDGGSPLVCPIEGEPGRYYLSGIVAWGIGCGETGHPDVYVDVAGFSGWINDTMTGQGLDTMYYFP